VASDALILAIDQGTTNTKAILVDRRGRIVAQASRPMAIEYPRPGWVQQDAMAVWMAVRDCIDESLAAVHSPPLAAIGISNQRESGLLWERASGRPVGPLVTWQCRRSADLCTRLREDGLAPLIEARTGLEPRGRAEGCLSDGQYEFPACGCPARYRRRRGHADPTRSPSRSHQPDLST
jgi:glycerol kinase